MPPKRPQHLDPNALPSRRLPDMGFREEFTLALLQELRGYAQRVGWNTHTTNLAERYVYSLARADGDGEPPKGLELSAAEMVRSKFVRLCIRREAPTNYFAGQSLNWYGKLYPVLLKHLGGVLKSDRDIRRALNS